MGRPSPYARQTAASIQSLVALFDTIVPDTKAHHQLKAIVGNPERWPEAHGERHRIRSRLLRATDDVAKAQYFFVESCLETLYNETRPSDAFDTVSPYWVVPRALSLAEATGVDLNEVIESIYSSSW